MLTPIPVLLRETQRSYTIHIAVEILSAIGAFIPKNTATVVIITDHHVKALHARPLRLSLQQAGFKTLLLSFAPGEGSKNQRTKSRLENRMLQQGCGRDSCIIALGGGVVGDVAGFIAATYMRGIPYIQVPTTLLAMVDSAIGGKTAIDTAYGKNLIGAYWQPLAVLADMAYLKTLPAQHLVNGLVEVIKIFLTCDKASFHWVQRSLQTILQGDTDLLAQIAYKAAKWKADIVQNDETEQHQRAILNCGHTIGHGLERLMDYQWLHGYAVGLGILVEAKIAQMMALISADDYQAIQTLLAQLQIVPAALRTIAIDDLIACTQSDKKKKAGMVHYVLLKGLGDVYINGNQYTHIVPTAMVEQAFSAVIED